MSVAINDTLLGNGTVLLPLGIQNYSDNLLYANKNGVWEEILLDGGTP